MLTRLLKLQFDPRNMPVCSQMECQAKAMLSSECGRIFSKIYDKRQSSDYDDFREFTKDEVENLYPQTLFLIGEVEKLIQSAG